MTKPQFGGLPPTFAAAHGAGRPRVFDPALLHYSEAFRPGEPAFHRPEAAGWWRDARRRATDHVLRAVAESPWGERLVLRGSRLLRAWLGDAAREPGDLDFVAAERDPGLFDGLAAAVAGRPAPPHLAFHAGGVAAADIWTYERADGRRVVFPWSAAGLPGGAVQVDVVFGEELAEPAVREPLPLADGEPAAVWAATPGLSLAWKLNWLHGDMHPQGKDLYDAALLAGRVFLPRDLLDRVFRGPPDHTPPLKAADEVFHSGPGRGVDWDNFRRECPLVTGGPDEWRGRLVRGLAATFAACDQPAASKVLPPPWRTADALGLARAAAGSPGLLPVLADALEEAGCADADVLGHCRGAGPHGRPCWVAAWLLGGG